MALVSFFAFFAGVVVVSLVKSACGHLAQFRFSFVEFLFLDLPLSFVVFSVFAVSGHCISQLSVRTLPQGEKKKIQFLRTRLVTSWCVFGAFWCRCFFGAGAGAFLVQEMDGGRPRMW